MSTTLAPPPASPPPVTAPLRPARGGAPARRAIRRWAWRLLRREWRQQVLVLALLTVAVAATTVGLGLVVNVQGSDQGSLGSANARVDVSLSGSNGLATVLDLARHRFSSVEAITHEAVSVPGSVTPVDVRAQDPKGRFGRPMLRVVSGRYPAGPTEVAVTRSVATIFGLKVGSTWSVNGQALRVVGLVENPQNLEDSFGLVAPGEIRAPSSVTLLLDANQGQLMNFNVPSSSGTVSGIMSATVGSAQQRRNQALAVLLIATIGLTFIGLLSVAGFTVMAHRRLRALGMLGAIGATDRHVRRVMLANGGAVGSTGAVLGVTVGLGVWFALTPAFEKVVGHRYDPLSLPWWAIIAGAVLSVLTALVASWWPARAVAKLPIVVALSGRPVPPQPVQRFALLGSGLAALGFVSLVLAHAVHTVLIIVGILAITGGMLLLAPLGIRALAGLASRAPVAVRLALRDLVRYQARSGSALAAASLAVGIAATIAITAAAQQAHDQNQTGGNLPQNQLIVWLDNPNDPTGGPSVTVGPGLSVAPSGGKLSAPATPAPAVVASARSTADAIARMLGAGTAVELDTPNDLTTLVPAGAPPDSGEANVVHPINAGTHREGWTQVATPYVATASLLRFYRIPAGDIGSAVDVISSRRDLKGDEVGSGFNGDFTNVTTQFLGQLPKYSSAPNTLMTTKEMLAGGYTAVAAGWLVQTKKPLTAGQLSDARHAAAAAGITIESRVGPDPGLQNLRTYSTLAGLLVALGVLAMTVGLIRSETAGDLRVLSATGASGRTRRTLNAASAGALALLGGILGTATAYVALIAWHWHHINYLDSPPYANLALLMLGLPLVGMIGAWLLGRTPTEIARRPAE
jgi:putative ABC transport system permease protein